MEATKDRWVQVTGDEVKALIANGKYHEDKPFWVRQGEALWVLVNAQLAAWRETYGKRL